MTIPDDAEADSRIARENAMRDDTEISESDAREAYRRLLAYQRDQLEKENRRHERTVESIEGNIAIIMNAAQDAGLPLDRLTPAP